MKKPSSHFVLEHGITLLTGTLLGATFAAGMTYDSSKDFWQTVGSLSAGFGTVCLLIFGYITAHSWKHQIEIKEQREAAFKWYMQSKQFHDLACSKLIDQFYESHFANGRASSARHELRHLDESCPEYAAQKEELEEISKKASLNATEEWKKLLRAFSKYQEERKSLSSIEGVLLAANISNVTKERIIACNDLLVDQNGNKLSETDVYNGDRRLLADSLTKLRSKLELTLSDLIKID